MNKKPMLSQNRNVLKLISGISTHVANISDKLLTLENKVNESMNIKVERNTSAIKAIERNIAALVLKQQITRCTGGVRVVFSVTRMRSSNSAGINKSDFTTEKIV